MFNITRDKFILKIPFYILLQGEGVFFIIITK